MARIVESIEIDRRPEDVFAYLDQLDRHKEWDEQIVETRVETDGPTRVGTRATDTRLPFGKQDIQYEITAHDPPRRSAFRGLGAPVRPVGSVTVEPLDDGARSRVTLEFELEGTNFLGKLLAPLGNREARRHVPNQQARLKERLESGTT